MRISARNILAGTVKSVEKGKVVAIVKVELKSGDVISSIITDDSVDRLGLKPGVAAYVIVKASSVMIGKGGSDLKLSARNIVKGTINKIKEGMVMAEIGLDVGNGETISATISDESTKKLGLKEGEEALAVFKATSVMIGVD
ncbi:MAG: TOBE domain-containing protein [Thermodesulfovibrionales bacterium]